MLIWFDTRDVCAHGLTAGVVERAAVQAVIGGTMSVRHETKTRTGRNARRRSPEALPSTDPEED